MHLFQFLTGRFGPCGLAALCVIAFGTACASKNRSTAPAAPRAVQNLEYGIEVAAGRDGARRVNSSHVFRNGDRFRFVFRSDFDAFVYLFSRGTGEGAYSRLFPHGDLQVSNVVRPDFEVLVPSGGGWLEFDDTPGTEHLVLAVSNRPLRQLEDVGSEVEMDRLDYTLSQLSRMRGYSASQPNVGGGDWTRLTLRALGSPAVRVERLALTHHGN